MSILVAPISMAGVEVGNFVSYRDIREKKQTDARLQLDALHDPLTGLANRALFLDRLQLTMARQQRHSRLNFAVMFLDLDRFKAVNDNLGSCQWRRIASADGGSAAGLLSPSGYGGALRRR